jgi:hypothetical protein
VADARDLDIAMDAQSLYREEIYTDRKIGTIRVMVPVTPMGATDGARSVLYTGEAQIMTQVGPLPISFEIEAKTLAEAVERYAETAKVAVERTVKELQEMRRQAASGLVIPSATGGLGGPGGLPPVGRGGKIQLP